MTETRVILFLMMLQAFSYAHACEQESTDDYCAYGETRYYGSEDNPLFVKESKNPPTDEEKSDKKYEREATQQELILTDRISWYTFLLFIATAALVLATACLVRVGRLQVSDAREATNRLKSVERAHIFETLHDPQVFIGKCQFPVDITNHGSTVAMVTKLLINGTVSLNFPDGLLSSYRSMPSQPKGFPIVKGTPFPYTASVMITSDQMQEILNWNQFIFLVGVVEYVDIFGDTHERLIRWRVVCQKSGLYDANASFHWAPEGTKYEKNE